MTADLPQHSRAGTDAGKPGRGRARARTTGHGRRGVREQAGDKRAAQRVRHVRRARRAARRQAQRGQLAGQLPADVGRAAQRARRHVVLRAPAAARRPVHLRAHTRVCAHAPGPAARAGHPAAGPSSGAPGRCRRPRGAAAAPAPPAAERASRIRAWYPCALAARPAPHQAAAAPGPAAQRSMEQSRGSRGLLACNRVRAPSAAGRSTAAEDHNR